VYKNPHLTLGRESQQGAIAYPIFITEFRYVALSCPIIMSEKGALANISLEAIVEWIFSSRQISRIHQKLLMSVKLSNNLISDAEKQLLDQVFDGLQRGFLKVVD
jgi:hypothetical protein